MDNEANLIESVTLADLPSIGPDWRGVAISDFDNNGRSDLLWHKIEDGGLTVWLLENAHLVETVELTNLPQLDSAWRVAGLADFDDDGQTDILWQNTGDGGLAVWFMDGLNRLSATVLTSQMDPSWRLALLLTLMETAKWTFYGRIGIPERLLFGL